MDQVKALIGKTDPQSQAKLEALRRQMMQEHLAMRVNYENTCKSSNTASCRQVLAEVTAAIQYFNDEAAKTVYKQEVRDLYGTLRLQAIRALSV